MAFEPGVDPLHTTASIDLLAEALANSPIGFGYLDTEFRYKTVNQALADFHGPAIEDHLGRPMVDVIGTDAFDAIAPTLQRALDTGEQFELSVDGRLLAQSRIPKHAVVHGYPVRDQTGVIGGLLLLAVDTTTWRDAETHREEIDSQLQLALDAAGMGLWSGSADGSGEVSWSRHTARLLGLDPDQPPSRDALFSVMDEPSIEGLRQAIAHSATTGVPIEYEYRVSWPDNSAHWLLAKGRVQNTDEGQRVYGIVIDITTRHTHEAEDALSSARQARAGEQAVRMQRVTAALSQAATVSQVCEVLLGEGASAINSPRRIVALLNQQRSAIERMQYEGYGDQQPHLTAQQLSDEFPIPYALRTGETVLLSTREEVITRFPDFRDAMKTSRAQACAVFPLVSNGEILGAWTLAFTEERQFEEGELIILLTLAAQGARALQRAQLYERERTISNSLQSNLLPQGVPHIASLDTATRYRPGSAGVQIGGDWYDAIRLNTNRVGLIIGDVGGHNIDSATTMGQLRSAIRSYAWENHPPGRILELTNKLLCGLEPGKLATCCYIELNLDDGIATLATAGHPPPLFMTEDGASFVELPPGTPLGTTADQEYKQSSLFLSPGHTLALYTDGLVESRTLGVLQGMQNLSAAVGEHFGDSPEDIADILMKANASELQDDDIAVLVATFQPTKAQTALRDRRSIHRYLPASAASAGVARRFAADVMADWGAFELVDQVELCVSELVTNALIHTAADVELVMRLTTNDVRVEVIDHSDRLPVVRSSGDEDTSGRGLHIIEAIASNWGVEPAASGKAVWFEIERRTSVDSTA